MRKLNIFLLILLAIGVLANSGCVSENYVQTYNFTIVFSQMMDLDTKYSTSFYSETITEPASPETVESLLEEIRKMRQNNQAMKISEDYDEIELLLDSRENLLLSEQNIWVFKSRFNGKGDCSKAESDYSALSYLDTAVEHAITANSRLDKLVTESGKARNIILGAGRPAIYDSNYGELTRESLKYKSYIKSVCKLEI